MCRLASARRPNFAGGGSTGWRCLGLPGGCDYPPSGRPPAGLCLRPARGRDETDHHRVDRRPLLDAEAPDRLVWRETNFAHQPAQLTLREDRRERSSDGCAPIGQRVGQQRQEGALVTRGDEGGPPRCEDHDRHLDARRRAEARRPDPARGSQVKARRPPEGARVAWTTSAEPSGGSQLEQQRRPSQLGPRIVHEAAEQRRRQRERDARDDAVGPPREGHGERVVLDDDDVFALETAAQPRGVPGLALDRHDARAPLRQRPRQRSPACAEIEDEITARHARGIDQLSCEPWVSKVVRSGSVRRSAPPPGHGRP